jgi:hypothetical protein
MKLYIYNFTFHVFETNAVSNFCIYDFWIYMV